MPFYQLQPNGNLFAYILLFRGTPKGLGSGAEPHI